MNKMCLRPCVKNLKTFHLTIWPREVLSFLTKFLHLKRNVSDIYSKAPFSLYFQAIFSCFFRKSIPTSKIGRKTHSLTLLATKSIIMSRFYYYWTLRNYIWIDCAGNRVLDILWNTDETVSQFRLLNGDVSVSL